MKVKLDNVRIAFIQGLFSPKAFGADSDGEKKYSSTFIFPKTHSAFKLVNEAISEATKEKFEGKAAEVLKQLRAGDKVCLRDGDMKPSYEGFPGNFFVTASNKARPLVIDRDKSPLTASDGKPYAGCYVNATIDIWAQNSPKWGKRINATLSGIQFLKDGDAFTGAPPASVEDFEDLAVEEDASDLVA